MVVIWCLDHDKDIFFNILIKDMFNFHLQLYVKKEFCSKQLDWFRNFLTRSKIFRRISMIFQFFNRMIISLVMNFTNFSKINFEKKGTDSCTYFYWANFSKKIQIPIYTVGGQVHPDPLGDKKCFFISFFWPGLEKHKKAFFLSSRGSGCNYIIS